MFLSFKIKFFAEDFLCPSIAQTIYANAGDEPRESLNTTLPQHFGVGTSYLFPFQQNRSFSSQDHLASIY